MDSNKYAVCGAVQPQTFQQKCDGRDHKIGLKRPEIPHFRQQNPVHQFLPSCHNSSLCSTSYKAAPRYNEPRIKLCTKWGLLFGRKWYDQLHTHQGSLCTSCLGSCILIHIQQPFTVHYKLTKSLLLPILDGHVTFIKREEYKASLNYNDTNSSRN